MWDLKKNFKKEEKQLLFPLCETDDDTTDDVLKCGRDRDRKQRNIKNNTEKEWEKVVQIFRENARKIEKIREKV